MARRGSRNKQRATARKIKLAYNRLINGLVRVASYAAYLEAHPGEDSGGPSAQTFIKIRGKSRERLVDRVKSARREGFNLARFGIGRILPDGDPRVNVFNPIVWIPPKSWSVAMTEKVFTPGEMYSLVGPVQSKKYNEGPIGIPFNLEVHKRVRDLVDTIQTTPDPNHISNRRDKLESAPARRSA